MLKHLVKQQQETGNGPRPEYIIGYSLGKLEILHVAIEGDAY